MKTLREMMDLVEGKTEIAEDFNLERIGHAECPVCHNNDLDWDEDTQTVGCRGCGSEFEPSGKQIKPRVREEASPEAVEKINKLYQDKQ